MLPVERRGQANGRILGFRPTAAHRNNIPESLLRKACFGRVFARGGGASAGQRTGRSVRRTAVTATVAGEPERRGFMEPACR